MNVHKRCQDNVANTCGINPRHMADILSEMVSKTQIFFLLVIIEFMFQLQTFTTSDDFFFNCFDKNKLQNRKKKLEKNYLILMK